MLQRSVTTGSFDRWEVLVSASAVAMSDDKAGFCSVSASSRSTASTGKTKVAAGIWVEGGARLAGSGGGCGW